MKNKIIQRFSVNSPVARKWVSFNTLAIIIFCVLGCSKDELSGAATPSGNGSAVTNPNIYFRLNFREIIYPYKVNLYTTYGEYKKNILPPGNHQSPSLEAITTKDSTGDSATEVRIKVPQYVQGLLGGWGRFGDLDVNFKLIKKGTNIIGRYTTEVRDSTSDDYFQQPRISIMSIIPGSHNNGGYFIDSTSLEFNITKTGISDTDGAFVEGDFSFRLYPQFYTTMKIPVSGTFRLFRY